MPQAANLLFFFSDNHARSALGCYGHPVVRTPTLDRMASRGVRFASAYSPSPICCPARAALATGRFPHETGYWDNAIVYDGQVQSWMHGLRERGYDVVSVGKLHFRSSADDNGFSAELEPMHILNGKGGVSMLLRWSDEEPVNVGQWELYLANSKVGETPYQEYDRTITRLAIERLRENAQRGRPWALFVSYPSPHPPFTVPRRLLDLYPAERMPLPPAFRVGERPEHAAITHLRQRMGFREMDDPSALRKIAACYFALITHLDEQIGAVLGEAESLGVLAGARVIYASDHGEALGAHGLFGKANLYEPAAGIPLIAFGPDLPSQRVIGQPVSLADLCPTILEGAGASPARPGALAQSIWPLLRGAERAPVFAEYHAAGSRRAAFMLRANDDKLIYHVEAPAQLFDLAQDPDELRDLAGDPAHAVRLAELIGALRAILDPVEVDLRARRDQRAKAEHWGGNGKILEEGLLIYTPPPGGKPEVAAVAVGGRP